MRHGRFPAPLVKFLKHVTPEIESLVRGPKHFALQGPAGWRDRQVKTIGLPDGRRARLHGGWTVQWDDMSLNQPYYVLGPDGQPILCRQSLIARDVGSGRWQSCELIARVRDAYTAADILRAVRHYCEVYGVPREIVFEQSVWASRAIKGWVIDGRGDRFTETTVERPAMSGRERDDLAAGIRALGCRLTFAKSANAKGHLEGGFNTFQRYLPDFTAEFPNMGRHAGEFERTAREIRRVKSGVIDPADAGFPQAGSAIERILECFDFLNDLPGSNGLSANEYWQQFSVVNPALEWSSAPARIKAVFLPVLAEVTIREGGLWIQREGRPFCFRGDFLVQLGDGYRVAVRFDPTEPSLGAAVFSREAGLRNFDQHAVGECLGMAQWHVPGPTTYADQVPDGVEVFDVAELHGAGAEEAADGRGLVTGQRRAVRGWVKSHFAARLPGQPKVVAAVARDGRGGKTEFRRGAGGSTAEAPAPAKVAESPRVDAPRRTCQPVEEDPVMRRYLEDYDRERAEAVV